MEAKVLTLYKQKPWLMFCILINCLVQLFQRSGFVGWGANYTLFVITFFYLLVIFCVSF